MPSDLISSVTHASGPIGPCGLPEEYMFRACELGKHENCERHYWCFAAPGETKHQHFCAHPTQQQEAQP